MPIFSGRTNLGAGTLNSNIIAGTPFEIAHGDGVLSFGFTSDEAAATADNILIDLFIGHELIASGFVPRASAAQPINPDDIVLRHPVLAGDRTIIKARNGAAGAKNVWWVVVYDMV